MPSASPLALVAALVAGAFIAIQPGVNSALARRLDHPIQASIVSFSVGLVILVAICLALRQRLPRPSMVAEVPLWMVLLGGSIGAFFVTTALVVAPRVGAAWWVALIVAGQMVTSLLLDHFGWLGFAQRDVSWTRVGGAALVVAGVILVGRR